MAVRDLSKVHKNALYRMRPDAVYASHGRQEYIIELDGSNYYIRRYRGGQLNRMLDTTFTSFKLAEETLVRWLKREDKWGKAIYPDKYD